MATTGISLGTGSGGVGQSDTTLVTQLTFNNTAEAVNYTLTNANAPLYVQELDLTVANQVISVPTKAGGVIIIPPAEATKTTVLKGVAGDTGIILAILSPTLIPFDTTPPTSFVLNSNGGKLAAVTCTAASATDKITSSDASSLANGDRVKFAATTIPGGLTSTSWYYVITATTTSFEVANTSGGSKIDLTSDGSGVTYSTANTIKLVWL